MRWVVSISSLSELESYRDLKVDFLVNFKECSKHSELSILDWEKINKFIPEDSNCYLNWDILMKDSKLLEIKNLLESIDLSKFQEIRVQDLGAYQYLVDQNQFKIQLLLESRCHNIEAIKTLLEVGKGCVSRVVLSSEIPTTQLKEYKSSLNIPLEKLIYGPILLFYTPRPLLGGSSVHEEIQSLMDSEESPHKEFPVIQNRHGTLMFHNKKLNLIDRIDQFGDIDYFHYSHHLSSHETKGLLALLLSESDKAIKLSTLEKTTRGYADVNKSNILFPKLKNMRRAKESADYLGVVIESKKGAVTSIKLDSGRSLDNGDLIIFKNPEGKEFELEVKSLKNSSFLNCDSVEGDRVAFVSYLSKAWPATIVYKR